MAEIDRSILGVWGPEGTMRVEHGKIGEFARAVKDDNPAFREGEAPPAPPQPLSVVPHWNPLVAQAFGSGVQVAPQVPALQTWAPGQVPQLSATVPSAMPPQPSENWPQV